MKIAISGKGGVGKTTVSAGIIKYFASKGNQVFAVDADPDISLGTVLGLSDETIDNLKPIVDMREVIAQKTGGDGAFFSLNPDVDDLVEGYVVTKGNIFFLKMGAVKQGGSSCYCRENTVLNALVGSLLIKEKEFVVLDMGAGIEHLTRGTANGVDLMLVVTEPSLVSVQTSRTVKKLANEIGVKNVKFIGNKIRSEKEINFLKTKLPSKDILGFIPFSNEVMEAAMGMNSYEKIPDQLNQIAAEILDAKF